jgi:hypothetical protein
MGKPFAICGLMLLGLLLATPTHAAEWGSVKGRFVVDGKPADLKPLLVDAKDPFCVTQKEKLENQAIVLGDDNALANVVAYLYLPRRGKVDIHPDYEAALKEPVVLDNNGCQFVPHVTLVRVGQTIVVKNSDPTSHNTNLRLFGQNPVVPANSQVEVKANKEGRLPEPVQCNIHTFMIGHLLSQNHPYMAVSGEDGTFEIKDLPAGKHTIQLWHEASGYLKDVATKGGKADRSGKLNVTVPAGKTLDLGDIKVPASLLKPR